MALGAIAKSLGGALVKKKAKELKRIIVEAIKEAK